MQPHEEILEARNNGPSAGPKQGHPHTIVHVSSAPLRREHLPSHPQYGLEKHKPAAHPNPATARNSPARTPAQRLGNARTEKPLLRHLGPPANQPGATTNPSPAIIPGPHSTTARRPLLLVQNTSGRGGPALHQRSPQTRHCAKKSRPTNGPARPLPSASSPCTPQPMPNLTAPFGTVHNSRVHSFSAP